MVYGESEKESGDKRDAFVRNRKISITRAVCAICGKDTETRLFVRDIRRADDCYDVYFCEQCRIGFTDPFPSSAVLSRLYASGSYRSADGTRFNGVLEFLVRFFTAGKARMIRKFHGSRGTLLDIGCGRGLFLDFMKKNGNDCLPISSRQVLV